MVDQRQYHYQFNKNISCVFKKFFRFLITPLVLSMLWLESLKCDAHLIHIDQNVFRSNDFARPQIPSLIRNSDELSHYSTTRDLTPLEYMVDLTNDLSYRILHYHSILNRNNFAFSPTALMSVLIALYEGSAGRSKIELKNILQLPNNDDIIRVGYRDIHRRLRTYFFGSDNPLKGLSLNKENVTITRDYETILMFYGYDLGVDMISSTTAVPSSTVTTITKTSTRSNEEQETIKSSTSLNLLPTSTTDSLLLTTMPNTNTSSTNTTETSLLIQVDMATVSSAEVRSISTDEISTTIKPEITTETNNVTMEDTEVNTENPTVTVTETTESVTILDTTEKGTETKEAAELISSFIAEENAEPFLRIQKARVTRLPSAKLQAPVMHKIKPQTNYLPAQRKAARLVSRNKRHLFGFKEYDSNLFVTLFNTESQLNNPLSPTASVLTRLPTYLHLSNDYEIVTDPNYIESLQTSSNLKENYNTDVISHVFYLNGQHSIYTTFKVYNAVLYYKYFDHLRMSVLELELDTTEYNLIILLPDYNTDLTAATSSLRSAPKLRLLRKQLKPKWVQAIIPDFKLDGTMFLTNDLQNLGICDIFEPNRANFHAMTDEKGIYVKHIEQTINVHIRTNPINQLRRNNGAQTQPIQISVNHPFMFFIIDRDLDVAVMAGRILNPLNVRVQ